ncbi:hypothetical protein E2R68_10725 [Psychromonas sp. RZ22]|uniref:hypothetical protein n=1 Tax=Psychromonas algarum TaxID=2555643 RepID=UPI0010687792|nr:hypothetical protein [Psychromonas sp. RZ22]TEW53951.1 hypothetical protein E2R68_10725 [Psychromonas sp. RZ22]
MSAVLQRSMLSLACVGLLSACLPEDESSNKSATTITMNSVVSGSQTLQLRGLDYDGIQPDVTKSRYVYKNRVTDSSTAVVFNITENGTTNSSDLVISAITDINDTYSALSVTNLTLTIDDKKITGDYVLIQEKKSGKLYPVISNGAPFASNQITATAYWHDSHRTSNIADEARLFRNDTNTGILNIFELSNGLFVDKATYDYSGKPFWINQYGDFLRQDGSNLVWYKRSEAKEIVTSFADSISPFLYKGTFYATKTSDNRVYSLEFSSLLDTISVIDDTTWADTSYAPTYDAVKRGNYEMTAGCEVYEFNANNPYRKEITSFRNFSATNGQLAVAGQNSLFCVHAASSNAAVSPIISFLNTATQVYNTVALSKGTVSDAGNLTVLSDTEVMFSETPSSSFKEYYVDMINEAEKEFTVTEASIVTIQTLAN